jgi:anaerobic selenocysteine-containing dehydrogenase
LSQGLTQSPTYDLLNTDYILNFGGDFLDEDPTPIRFNQIYVNLRNRNGEDKVEIVHISSYMSRTAANSTKSVQIRPGTMAALALGIANIMIRDKTYNKEFIENSSHGFSKWQDAVGTEHKGFRDLVLEDYYPEKVAEITGIYAKEIVELARDFASSKKALAISGKQAAYSTNSLYTLWAIYCLNALKGNLGKSGGLLFPKQRSDDFFSDINTDETGMNGLKKGKIGLNKDSPVSFSIDSFEQLLHNLENDEPYAIDTLILSQVNPLTESTCQNRFTSALQNIPFLVSCSTFMDQTTMLADLVLPESVFLENWEFSRNVPMVEYTHLGVQHPVITPSTDARHFGDILLHIAQSIGGPVSGAFPWENYQGFLQSYAKEIYNKSEGIIVSERVDLSWLEFLKKRGWRFFDYSTFDEFWDVLVDKGGWWIPTSAQTQEENLFKTKSGKFEFYSQLLQAEMKISYHEDDLRETQFEEMLRQIKIEARGDLIYMPHFESPRYENKNKDFPYHLLIYQSLSSNNGCGVHLGLLQELSGLHSHEYWNCWIEINPQTANRLGITDDEYVHIISPKGQISVKAKILPTVMPDVLMMPAGGLVNSEIHNPYTIFNTDNDLLSGASSLTSTMVRVVKDLNT